MNNTFVRIDNFTQELLQLEIEGRKLKDWLIYKNVDFSPYYQERLRFHLYEFNDPLHKASNFKPRGIIARHFIHSWKRLQRFLVPEQKGNFRFLFFDRPHLTRVKNKKLVPEFHQKVMEQFPENECALVMDLSPQEFIRYFFLKKKPHNFLNLWSYYQPYDQKEIKHFNKLSSQIIARIKPLLQKYGLKEKIFSQINQQILLYHLPNLILFYETFFHMLDCHHPRGIAFTMFGGEVRIANYAAHQRDIMAFSFPHGRIVDRASFVLSQLQPKESLPNYIVTSSAEEAKIVRKYPAKYEAVPLGFSRYDFLKDYKVDKDGFLDKHHLPKDKKIIFWPTQSHCMFKEEVDKNIAALMDFLRTHPQFFLIIKFHPREDQRESLRYHQMMADRYGVKNLVLLKFNEADTYDCIAVSEAIFTKASSVGIESILLGKPVLNFELMKIISLGVFEEIGLIIHSPEDIERYLNLIYTPKFKNDFQHQRKRFISKHFVNFGSAAEKTAAFLKKVTG